MTNSITVLVVDNEPGFADLVGEMLEREEASITAVSATTGEEALEVVAERSVDCIVSDYEMPDMTGLDLLDRVRVDDPDLPFILFTGRGSEELASEAIAAGVTQYLQKGSGEKQYALLANQITNAVSQYRTETELRESEHRYERTLTALHETTRDLMRAGTKREIYQEAVETAGDSLDIPIAAAYAFDPTEGVLEQVTSTRESQQQVDPQMRFERGDGHVWEVFSDGESAAFEELDGDGETRSRSELVVPLGSHGVLVAGTSDPDGFDEPMTELLHVLAANTEAALDRAEREELLREHDRTLTQQNEELTRLNHTNEIVREINHSVAQATTRSEIESTVCDRLVDTERYRFAWVASSDDDPPEPTAWAGVDAAFIDQLRDGSERAPEIDLVRDTLEADQVTLVRDVLEESGWGRRRKEALTYGFQTIMAVPLADDERRHGVLVVHVAGVDSVGESEREVFAELGETIGHAIRSVERTRAMLTDNRLEIELSVHDSRLLLNRATDRIDGPITVEGVLEGDDDTVFASFPATADLSKLEGWASIDALSVVSEGEDECLCEVTVSSSPFLDTLRAYDATLRTATGRAGSTRIVLELPPGVQPRSLVESLREGYPETELEARRETTSTPSARQLDTHLEELLTDRQFEALQAAHFSGFFEWPRESTGEDLADALEVSSPTYHYHLRAAERKLVGLAFDGLSN